MPAKAAKKIPALLLGAHMSIAGGMQNAIARGQSIGCAAIQVFLKNNNQWKGKTISDEEALAFKTDWANSDVYAVFGHDSYLINLASPDDLMFRKSVDGMVDEVERATLLGIPFIVIHPGSHVGKGEDWGLQRVIEGIDEVFERTPKSKVAIAFEGTAGQGTNLGSKFEHLAVLLNGVKNKKRVATCLDTCHLFAAGYDLRTQETYENTMQDFVKSVGLQNLVAFHLNDSKGKFNGRLDRHEDIGKGSLGLEPFRLILNDSRLQHIPKVLETPKTPDMKEDIANLAVLKSLVN